MIDDLDLKLIEELRDDGRAPYAKLAEIAGVNKATVSRRVNRLRRSIIPLEKSWRPFAGK